MPDTNRNKNQFPSVRNFVSLRSHPPTSNVLPRAFRVQIAFVIQPNQTSSGSFSHCSLSDTVSADGRLCERSHGALTSAPAAGRTRKNATILAQRQSPRRARRCDNKGRTPEAQTPPPKDHGDDDGQRRRRRRRRAAGKAADDDDDDGGDGDDDMKPGDNWR